MALLPSSSSSIKELIGSSYDVFLSCWIEDTREFTGHLYRALINKGFRIFTDFEVTDEITPELKEAIAISQIAIIVLSNSYASSSHCLDKLSEILDYFEAKGRLILRVFYHVDPDNVQRMLSGTYGEAIVVHEKRFNERLQKWTMALQPVANLPRWPFELGNEYDDQFIIRKIVEEVSNKIPLRCFLIESEVGKIIEIGDIWSDRKVRMIFGNEAKTTTFALDVDEINAKEAVDASVRTILKEFFFGTSEYSVDQDVYLDIACCFNGYRLVEVQHILRAHYGCCVTDYIRAFEDKRLINISSSGEITSDKVILEMGRESVRLESPKMPGKRTRLWIPEDTLHVLIDCTGTDKIETICLDLSSIEEGTIDWNGEGFKNMGNLKTLIIKNAHFSQAPRNLPNSLRVLEWQRYPSQYLPPNFQPENLAICKLPKRCFVSSEIGGLLNKKPVNLDDLSFYNGEDSNEMFYVAHLPNSEEITVMVSYEPNLAVDAN